MKAQNIEAILRTPPHWQQDGASFWMLDAFSGGHSWIGRYTGQSPWEMHPEGEELFYILDGAVEFTLLTTTSTEKVKVRAGEFAKLAGAHGTLYTYDPLSLLPAASLETRWL